MTKLAKNALKLYFFYSALIINFKEISASIPGIKTNLLECRSNISNSSADLIETPIVRGQKILGVETVLHNYKEMDFTLRGSIYFRTIEIQKELDQGIIKPFKKVTRLSIADSQSVGHKPIIYLRQMLALVTYPALMTFSHLMPPDAILKAQQILQDSQSGSIGSYSSAQGLEIIRKHVAKFISQRDGGIPSNWQDIYLTNGVTEAALIIMKLFQNECNQKDTGVLVPIPLYPLYSAVLTKYGIRQINYYLNETNNWELEISELERAYVKAIYNCNCKPRAILLINPGNPSGKILTRERMEFIIKFAYSKNLIILADEIFQDNIYREDMKFLSFKKVLMELGEPYNSMELISFHSVSKGYMSESGLRGGYFEFVNSDPKIKNVIFQLLSVQQCPNLLGQVALDCLVNPPKEGDASFKSFERQKNYNLETLGDLGGKMSQELNKLDGFNCSRIDGGIVAFTKVNLPLKVIQAAEAKGQKADEFYGLELLESTGISVAIGSAFGLHGNTVYLRMTIPSSLAKLDALLEGLKRFHVEFLRKYM